MTWNAGSLNNKADLFMLFVCDKNIDIAFIEETWLDDTTNHTTGIIKHFGYSLIHSHRVYQRGGGTAIIFKPNLHVVRVMLGSFTTLEYCAATTTENTGNKVLFCVIYRTGNVISEFFNELDNLLQTAFLKGDKVLLCGDINIHFNKPLNRVTINCLNITQSYSLKQYVHAPTHILNYIISVFNTCIYTCG